ncbi:hypothetical protein ACHMZP_33215 [Rhodococcus baikonurensis]|uniref:hypothetical protein n=1 Tax=Rhodococcus baikonurensis TaxID=172041 RepID=UPI00378B13D4
MNIASNRALSAAVAPAASRKMICPSARSTRAVRVERKPAVSHQLWLLRVLGLVTGTRTDRSIVYSLYDNHVAQLLDEAVYHVEHLHLGARDISAG